MESTPHEKFIQRYIAAANAIREQNHPSGPSQTETSTADASLVPMRQLLAAQAQLLGQELRTSTPENGGTVNLDLVLQRLQNLASVAMAKFYAYRHDLVPEGWRHLYTDALILKSLHSVVSSASWQGVLEDDVLNSIVDSLDRALITTGGQGSTLGPRWIEGTLSLLEEMQREQFADQERPSKRHRTAEAVFSSEEPYGRLDMRADKTCRKYDGWTLDVFEDYMNDPNKSPEPIVLSGLLSDWPALDDRPWNSVEYLLSQTLDGRRLVPVEVGRSYVDEGWGQELVKFGDFLRRYITLDSPSTDDDAPPAVGYLAQHDLFRQIPSLRGDTRTPDFCWADVPKHPTDPLRDQGKLDVPQLNAWFGPARTITPLHCDGYHNLLCQVVGAKYVRLYPPTATPSMRPRAPEHGVDMSNTSALDLGVIEGWDELPDDAEEDYKGLREELERLDYRECVLEPGDTLLIPIGWWHYVRSLSISFSVSFWWN